MEIKDLAGLSEPLGKLIDTLRGAGAGALQPWQIRRVAAAEGDALVIRARAEVLAELARANARVEARELARQANLEAIAGKAAEQLPPTASPDPVDPDWTAEFVNCAQDVSNEAMQSLWAKVLAGEVSKPGAFSRRTLQVVRVLSQRDAELFTKLCRFVSDVDGHRYHVSVNSAFLRLEGLDRMELMHLESIGLTVRDSEGLAVLNLKDREPHTVVYYGRTLTLKAKTTVPLAAMPLTLVGSELFPISGAEPHDEYYVDYQRLLGQLFAKL
jgi:hypothetical protein